MPERILGERTSRYILERQCRSGGFCFYRLEEPNGADTFYALATLKMLGHTVHSESTRRFLEANQKPDGSYDNLYQAYYAIRGLNYLGDRPRQDPRPYLREQLEAFPVENATLETQLKRLKLLIELCLELQIAIPSAKRKEMIDFILACHNEDGGFGVPSSNLLISYYALTCLDAIAFSLESLGSERFLRACEHPVHGFLNVPDMAPSFLEHILAGAESCRVLGYVPAYRGACRRFVVHCQSTNGGFSRSPGGLPTLQDTYRAVLAWVTLDFWERAA